jgi:putative membrane protein
MMYWGEHMSTGGWIFSILGTLIIVALVVGVVILAAQALHDRGEGTASGAARAESPREILDRRLASGELTVGQYDELLQRLGDTPSRVRNRRPTETAGVPG